MTAAIAAQGLGKRYRRTWALADCTLSVPAGHVVRSVGPVLDPAWTVSDVGLEDLMLAYMSAAAGRGRRNHLEVQR